MRIIFHSANSADSVMCLSFVSKGPVVTVHSFETEEEVIQQANNTKYGLAGSLWTTDLNVAHRVARKWETGMVSDSNSDSESSAIMRRATATHICLTIVHTASISLSCMLLQIWVNCWLHRDLRVPLSVVEE